MHSTRRVPTCATCCAKQHQRTTSADASASDGDASAQPTAGAHHNTPHDAPSSSRGSSALSAAPPAGPPPLLIRSQGVSILLESLRQFGAAGVLSMTSIAPFALTALTRPEAITLLSTIDYNPATQPQQLQVQVQEVWSDSHVILLAALVVMYMTIQLNEGSSRAGLLTAMAAAGAVQPLLHNVLPRSSAQATTAAIYTSSASTQHAPGSSSSSQNTAASSTAHPSSSPAPTQAARSSRQASRAHAQGKPSSAGSVAGSTKVITIPLAQANNNSDALQALALFILGFLLEQPGLAQGAVVAEGIMAPLLLLHSVTAADRLLGATTLRQLSQSRVLLLLLLQHGAAPQLLQALQAAGEQTRTRQAVMECLSTLISAADAQQVQRMCDAGTHDVLLQLLRKPWRNALRLNVAIAVAWGRLLCKQEHHIRSSSSSRVLGAAGEPVAKVGPLYSLGLADMPWMFITLVQMLWLRVVGGLASERSWRSRLQARAVCAWCTAEAVQHNVLLPVLSMSLLLKLLCLALIRLWCGQVLLLDSGLSLWGELLRLLAGWVPLEFFVLIVLQSPVVMLGKSRLQVVGTACYAWVCLSKYG